MVYLLYLLLAVTVFLAILNGFLRGLKKAQVGAFLSIVLIGLLVAVFWVYGWKTGLIAVAMTFVFAAVGRPLAARAASRLLATGSEAHGGFPGLPPKALERISRQLGRELTPKEMVQEFRLGSAQRDATRDALLDYCEAVLGVREVINEFRVSREDLRQVYLDLLLWGAGQWACGHWVAASALAYPDALRYVLESKACGHNGSEIALSLIVHFERGAPLQNR